VQVSTFGILKLVDLTTALLKRAIIAQYTHIYDSFDTLYYKHSAVLFRLALSILHFNENSNRQVRVTEEGEATYVTKFPKYKQGGYIVRAARVKATYGLQNLMYS
jgi:hypothetical protein